MISAHVSDDFATFGVRMAIVSRPEGNHPCEILRLTVDDGRVSFKWEQLDPHMIVEPTLTLPGDIARTLLDGLSQHFQGATDTRVLRQDYTAERTRVDRLTAALIGIAENLALPPVELADPTESLRKFAPQP